ncbi:MAG: sugar phosphate nucleotidyltransferase [Candidatus Kapaibacteriales bacterium]
MKVIIPVAGIGRRLRPHTYFLPKVLLNVAGKPIIAHILDNVIKSGLQDIVIITGHLGDEVEEFVRLNYSANFKFIQQVEPLGLGHAIWCAKNEFQGEPILILLGDTILDFDLNKFIEKDKSIIGIHQVGNPSRFGVVVTDSKKKIIKFVEKPKLPISNLAIVGVYYIKNSNLLAEALDKLIAQNIRTHKEYQLTDALQMMIDRGEEFSTYLVDGWYDCGKFDSLLDTNKILLAKFSSFPKIPDTVVIPPVFIANDAVVHRSIIGPYATVASKATVLDSIVRNSIVSSGARVEAYLLNDSIIGNNAIVRGHFYRFNVANSSEINIE